MMKDTAPKIYQLKIELEGSEPLIWRRFYVSGDTTLGVLHAIIQTVMGWENAHLYQFNIDRRLFSENEDENDDFFFSREEYNAWEFSLDELIPRAGKRFTYTYDFGDNWAHTIKVEKTHKQIELPHLPYLESGEIACPLEDSGGIGGYYEKLAILSDQNHPDYASVSEYFAEDFQPRHFDADPINQFFKNDFGNFNEAEEVEELIEEVVGELPGVFVGDSMSPEQGAYLADGLAEIMSAMGVDEDDLECIDFEQLVSFAPVSVRAATMRKEKKISLKRASKELGINREDLLAIEGESGEPINYFLCRRYFEYLGDSDWLVAWEHQNPDVVESMITDNRESS